jgi:hypothetical protein
MENRKYRPDLFAFKLLYKRSLNKCSPQFLNWGQQHATGMLHLDYSNLGAVASKKDTQL